jgi:hypothetical protein
MASNPDFLKDTGIWEDFIEHQEAFDQVQQELEEQYQRGGSTKTSTTQMHETTHNGEQKQPPKQEYIGDEITTDQESRSNDRKGTAIDTPHPHTAPTTSQLKITTESTLPQTNTELITSQSPQSMNSRKTPWQTQTHQTEAQPCPVC